MSSFNRSGFWEGMKKKYRKMVVFILVLLAIANAVIRFWGEWEYFFSSLLGHFLFGQAIVAFLYDKTMVFGAGNVSLEDGTAARSIAIVFAILGYSVMFLFNGYPWR